MKILVTGGTGFIGSNLVKTLVDDGHEVTVIGHRAEQKLPKVKRFIECSFEGINWTQVCNKDVCFHLAAINDTTIPFSTTNQSEMWRANVHGPIKLFMELAKSGCKQFVYASSTAVYGNSEPPYVEEVTPVAPLNLYAESKAAFDNFAMKFAEDYNVNVVGLRYCNVYGPGEEHKGPRSSMIYQLLKQISSGKAPKLFKEGTQKRDWVFVQDVVEANLCAAFYKGRDIFNIGSGTATSFNDVVKAICDELNVDVEIEYIDNPYADQYQEFTLCDISKARRKLSWIPCFSLEKGIKEFGIKMPRLSIITRD